MARTVSFVVLTLLLTAQTSVVKFAVWLPICDPNKSCGWSAGKSMQVGVDLMVAHLILMHQFWVLRTIFLVDV